MKILSEKEEDNGTYTLDVEFEDGELNMLVNYAVNDILKKQVESEERKGKSYCSECKHLKVPYLDFHCTHPNNCGDWYSRKGERIDPHIRNKNNDCNLFERKEWLPDQN